MRGPSAEVRPSGPSSRVFDTTERGSDRRIEERGFGSLGSGSSDRDTTDFSSWGRTRRAPIPVLSGSSSRPGPASSRTGADKSPTRGFEGGASRSTGRTTSGSDRVRISPPAVDRGKILERYRGSTEGSRPLVGRETTSGSSGGPGAGRLRGTAPRAIDPGSKRGLPESRAVDRIDRASQRPKPSTSGSPSGAPERARRTTKIDRSIARDVEADGLKSIARTAKSDPKAGREILKTGRVVSATAGLATRTALGFGVGFGTGSWNHCFWDPFDRPGCGPVWDWWCSPGWAWWWSTCATPWWGWGWGFGHYSSHFGFWYSCWPSYACSYPVYYAPYPVYCSSVIYDTYDAPTEIVYVDRPVYVDPAPVEAGEGTIRVDGAGGTDRPAMASSSQFLTLGDQAFREGRYSDAVHYYAKAVELEPGQGVLHLILSDALFATGDYHYAAYSLRRALELDPQLVDSVSDKHAFYSDPTEFDRQLELLERYLADHFLDDDARLLLGANYLFGGKPAQAADLLQSPFSVAIRESGAGKLLLARAQALREAPTSSPSGG